MKRIIGSIGLFGMLLAPAAAFAKDTSATFDVSGWHCEGCSGKTEAELKKVKGVKTVTADTEKKRVVVAYDDSQTNEAALKKAIQTAGFQAKKAN
jgi:copper chaperone CopZ